MHLYDDLNVLFCEIILCIDRMTQNIIRDSSLLITQNTYLANVPSKKSTFTWPFWLLDFMISDPTVVNLRILEKF